MEIKRTNRKEILVSLGVGKQKEGKFFIVELLPTGRTRPVDELTRILVLSQTNLIPTDEKNK